MDDSTPETGVKGLTPLQQLPFCNSQGPNIQSLLNLTSLLVVKMLTVLVSTISNSQLFLLKSYSHFFSKYISIFAIFNDQSFNNTLTNDIVSFEQLSPVLSSQDRWLLKKRFHCVMVNGYTFRGDNSVKIEF